MLLFYVVLDFADDLCGDSSYQHVAGDIMSYDGTCGDDNIIADGYAWQDGNVVVHEEVVADVNVLAVVAVEDGVNSGVFPDRAEEFTYSFLHCLIVEGLVVLSFLQP